MATRQDRRRKHVPQRTCVGCRTTKAKRDLVRLVGTGENEVTVDETGKRPGRGAYLCLDYSCWQEGLRRGRLAHALRTQLSPRAVESLERFAERYRADQAAEAERKVTA